MGNGVNTLRDAATTPGGLHRAQTMQVPAQVLSLAVPCDYNILPLPQFKYRLSQRDLPDVFF